MKSDISQIAFAIAVFVALEVLFLSPSVAAPDCDLVCEGSYVIDGIDTVADLEALSGCTSITGSLTIHGSPLTSLEGLECLTHIEGDLEFIFNDSLASLTGLESLETIDNRLLIWSNESLINLAGLESIESLRDLWIHGNDSLISLRGLDSLESVGQYLGITSNNIHIPAMFCIL